MSTYFKHDHLLLGSIRLIHLSKDISDGLSCTLHTFSFQDAPDYEALSYAWGDLTVTDNLTCNGALFPITTNLYAALDRLRSLPPPEYLWVDQLSINQADIDERSREVNVMGSIYSKAQRVILWVGPDPGSQGQIALDFMRYIADQKIGYLPRLETLNDELLATYHLPALASEEWTAVRTLAGLPYFERAWVLQEVVLSQRKVILWGELVIDWTYFEIFAEWLFNSTAYIDDGPSLTFTKVQVRYLSALTERERDLALLLQNTIGRKASDQRDKIYSLLSLADTMSGIRADYSKSIPEVYCDAARAVIYDQKSLDALSEVYHDGNVSLNEWPSWAARYISRPLDNFRPRILARDLQRLGFAATAELPVQLMPLDQDPLRISLQGIKISEVSNCGTGVWHSSASASAISLLLEVCSMVLLESGHESINEALVELIVRTVLCGALHASKDNSQEEWRLCHLHFATSHAISLKFVLLEKLLPQPSQQQFKAMIIVLATAAAIGLGISLEGTIELETTLPRLIERAQAKGPSYRIKHLTQISWDSYSPRYQSLLSSWDYCETSYVKQSADLLSLCEFLYESNDFWQIYGAGFYRKAFTTSDGHPGRGPKIMKEGDFIVLLFGGGLPFVLRRIPDSDSYYFIGESYVDGLMFGEVVKGLQASGELEAKTTQFTLR